MSCDDKLSRYEIATLEHIMENGMKTCTHAGKTLNKDAIFLKKVVMTYKVERIKTALAAIKRASKPMEIQLSQIQYDPKFLVPLITVTTPHKRFYCVIGYDIDHYTLSWYESSSGNDSKSIRAHSYTVPNTEALVVKLQEGYKMFSGL